MTQIHCESQEERLAWVAFAAAYMQREGSTLEAAESKADEMLLKYRKRANLRPRVTEKSESVQT